MTIHFPNESADHRVARDRLLSDEIALRRAMEAVAVSRRALPPGGLVPEDYFFDRASVDGAIDSVRLSALFAPERRSLVVYQFMFPRHPHDDRPGRSAGALANLARQDGPCPSCVALLDQLDPVVPHFEDAGFDFVVVAKTTPERLAAVAADRGWRHLHLLSAARNTFKRDYHGEMDDGSQMPMLNVFHKAADGIRHFWSAESLLAPADPGQDPRHVGTLEPLFNLMDMTPDGRPGTWFEQMEYACCRHA